MKNTIIFGFMLLMLSLSQPSCKKEQGISCFEPALPALTQNGAQTMGCLWNGKPWENYTITPAGKDTLLARDFYNDGQGVIVLAALRVEDECSHIDQRLVLTFEVVGQDSVANFNLYANDWGPEVKPGFVGYHYYIHPDEEFTHRVTRLNTVDNFFAAEFEGVLIDTVANETLRIENGRIDAQFY